jgi:hypothetical protein
MCVYLQEYIIHTYELHYMHSHSTAKSGKEIITVHVNIHICYKEDGHSTAVLNSVADYSKV